MSSTCRFHAISAKFAETFSNRGKDLVVGFTVKHEEHKYGFCGGGYIKLLPGKFEQGNTDFACFDCALDFFSFELHNDLYCSWKHMRTVITIVPFIFLLLSQLTSVATHPTPSCLDRICVLTTYRASMSSLPTTTARTCSRTTRSLLSTNRACRVHLRIFFIFHVGIYRLPHVFANA